MKKEKKKIKTEISIEEEIDLILLTEEEIKNTDLGQGIDHVIEIEKLETAEDHVRALELAQEIDIVEEKKIKNIKKRLS